MRLMTPSVPMLRDTDCMPAQLHISGQVFGQLTVIGRSEDWPKLWECVCSCGGMAVTTAAKLRTGHTRSCGCIRKRARYKPPIINRAGIRYGRWTAMELVDKDKDGASMWRCRCDCGNEKNIRGNSLAAGQSTSCGCLRSDTGRRMSKLNFAERYKRNTLPSGRAGAWALFRRYEESAVKRGLDFQITFDTFIDLTSSECTYCGIAPHRSYGVSRGNGRYSYNGIDRLDNSCGYVKGNIAACCYFCNSAKRTLGTTEFYAWIERVYKRHLIHREAVAG